MISTPGMIFGTFVIGMIVQAFLMLIPQWGSGDLKKLSYCLLGSLFSFVPGKHEHDYNVPTHLFTTCLFGAFIFVTLFRDKLLVKITGQSVLVWNMLFLVVVINHVGISLPVLFLCALPTILTVASSFSDFDKSFGWQVFFYVWFSIMIVAIGIFHFSFAALNMFWGDSIVPMSFVEVVIAGSSFLYILVHAWYVLALIPLPGKHQSFSDRWSEVCELFWLLESGYIWKQDTILLNLILLLVLPTLFILNYYMNYCSELTVISITLMGVFMINYLTGAQRPQTYTFSPKSAITT